MNLTSRQSVSVFLLLCPPSIVSHHTNILFQLQVRQVARSLFSNCTTNIAGYFALLKMVTLLISILPLKVIVLCLLVRGESQHVGTENGSVLMNRNISSYRQFRNFVVHGPMSLAALPFLAEFSRFGEVHFEADSPVRLTHCAQVSVRAKMSSSSCEIFNGSGSSLTL